MSGSFGRKRSRSKTETKPLFSGTDFSTRAGGKISFDPSIRGLQERGLESAAAGQREFGQAVGQFGADLGEVRSRLLSNQDPFTQAMVAPAQERFAAERGALQRDIGRRGLAGSSFGQQAQTAQATAQERDLANLRATATGQSLEAVAQIDQMLLNAAEMERRGDFEQANLLRATADDRMRTEFGVMTAAGGFSKSKSIGISLAGGMGPSGGGGGVS